MRIKEEYLEGAVLECDIHLTESMMLGVGVTGDLLIGSYEQGHLGSCSLC